MAGKQLTVIERAQRALSRVTKEAALSLLAATTKDITVIKDEADYELIKTAQLKLTRARTGIEKEGKMIRDDANAFSKAVIAEQRRLVGIIEPEENRLKAMRKVVDDEKARIEREAAEAEQRRIDNVAALISKIRSTIPPIDSDSQTIGAAIDWLRAEPIDDRYQEFGEQAAGAVSETLEICERRLEARLKIEKEQQRLQAEAARQRAAEEKLAAERKAFEESQRKAQALLAARQAELDRQRKEQEAAKVPETVEPEAVVPEAVVPETVEPEAAKAESPPDSIPLSDINKLRDYATAVLSIQVPALSDSADLYAAYVLAIHHNADLLLMRITTWYGEESNG